MVKLLSIFSALMLMFKPSIGAEQRPNYKSFLTYSDNERGNQTVTGVASSYKSSDIIRVYSYEDMPVDEIADDAFVDTEFTSFVLSRNISHISDAVFTNAPNITHVEYTGSIAEFNALNLSFNINYVSEYAVDEGFIYFWDTVIRPTAETDICTISKDTFNKAYGLYKALIPTDLEVVNAYEDKGGAKIGDSMKVLISLNTNQPSQNQKDEWNQTGAITLIIVISIIGMTSITIFFLFKTKKLID